MASRVNSMQEKRKCSRGVTSSLFLTWAFVVTLDWHVPSPVVGNVEA